MARGLLYIVIQGQVREREKETNMRYIVRYKDAPANDNYEKICTAQELDDHVQYMIDCCISELDIEILVCQRA